MPAVSADIDAALDAASINSRHLDLPRLNRQELEFAAAFAATSDVTTAAKRCGISREKAILWSDRRDINAHVAAILRPHQEAVVRGVHYTLADAHADLEMGKRMSANAGEWFKGVELQMKLHGLLDRKGDSNINVNVQLSGRKQFEELDDATLLQAAGFTYEDLLPQIIEGECSREEDTPDVEE